MMDSREKTAGEEEMGGGDKICKERKLNPRQKYQNWCPLAPQLPFLVTDEKSGGDFEYFMSPHTVWSVHAR